MFCRSNRPTFKGLVCSSPSPVARHLKKMSDINNLIARVARGDNTAIKAGAFFGDVSALPDDLQGMLNMELVAREAFLSLPSEVQHRYTSYEAYINALYSDDERDFLIKHGILKQPEAEPSPVKVQVVNNETVTTTVKKD